MVGFQDLKTKNFLAGTRYSCILHSFSVFPAVKIALKVDKFVGFILANIDGSVIIGPGSFYHRITINIIGIFVPNHKIDHRILKS